MTVSSAGAIKELVGLRLVIGVQGTAVDKEMAAHFKALGARGLILYRRNFQSPAQVRKLVGDLEEAVGRRLLVTVDHEGGRVVMFREGFTIFPDNLAFGKVGKDEYVRRQGAIEAAELRWVGVDVNLAPDLDVLTERYGPSLNRSYSKDPERVARLGAARIQAMQAGGVSATAKHFPGKGHASVDAHLTLPTIDSTLEEMEAWHLKPFHAAVRAGVDCVMTSHPLYRRIDPDGPATFSKIIVGHLRGAMGFRGVVVTDDLEMGAVKEVAKVEEASVRAAAAGHDLFLVCHTYEAEGRAQAALQKAYEDGTLDRKELERAAGRIETLLARRKDRFGPEPRTAEEGAELARRVARESVTVLREGTLPVPVPREVLEETGLVVLFPRFSDIAPRIVIEDALTREREFLETWFAARGLKVEVRLVGPEPKPAEADAVVTGLEGRTVLVFPYDTHFYPLWKKVLEDAQARAKHSLVVPLRNPYDMERVKDRATAVTAWGFRRVQLEAVLEKLFD